MLTSAKVNSYYPGSGHARERACFGLGVISIPVNLHNFKIVDTLPEVGNAHRIVRFGATCGVLWPNAKNLRPVNAVGAYQYVKPVGISVGACAELKINVSCRMGSGNTTPSGREHQIPVNVWAKVIYKPGSYRITNHSRISAWKYFIAGCNKLARRVVLRYFDKYRFPGRRAVTIIGKLAKCPGSYRYTNGGIGNILFNTPLILIQCDKSWDGAVQLNEATGSTLAV